MTRSIRRDVPVAFLIAALLLFIAFHFLPPEVGTEDLGWTVWVELWEVAFDPKWLLTEPLAALAIAAYLAFSLLLVASPFLIPVLRKSRMAWLGLTILSALSGGGFWLAMLDIPPEPSPGLLCLLVANSLNFLGLLMLRWGTPKADRGRK